MSENNTEITEKSTSEELNDLWGKLSKNQRRFVVAVQEHPNKKEAAIAIGIEPNTVYRWNGEVDKAIELMSKNIIEGATAILQSSVAKAAIVKIDGLDSEDEKTRQSSATEVLDRMLGRAVQRNELGGPGGGPIPLDPLLTKALERIYGDNSDE